MTIRPYQTGEYLIASWSIDYSEHHGSGPSTWFATPNDTALTSRPLPVLRALLFFITLQLHAVLYGRGLGVGPSTGAFCPLGRTISIKNAVAHSPKYATGAA